MASLVTDTGVSFQRERLQDAWAEALPLLALNENETGACPSEFSPAYETYVRVEEANTLYFFTVRASGVLVGYACFFLTNHLHYSHTKWALQDVLFVSKKYRGPTALKFLSWVDAELKRAGAKFITRQVTNFVDYSRTLTRMGYEPCERAYIKRL